MAHKAHEQFTGSVFKKLCDAALDDLPADARDEESALEHLLTKVKSFCGVEAGQFRDSTGVPRLARLKQQIIDVVERDSILEHPTSSYFRKEPIIDEYVLVLECKIYR